jgi:hypothetical protein
MIHRRCGIYADWNLKSSIFGIAGDKQPTAVSAVGRRFSAVSQNIFYLHKF